MLTDASGRSIRRDALPEYVDYRDTGCELAPSCLNCPFIRCRYDYSDGIRGLLVALETERHVSREQIQDTQRNGREHEKPSHQPEEAEQ